jgi:hypothetical protein
LEDVDDLFARMPVLRRDISRVKIDAHLNDLASGSAEIVPLRLGTFGSHAFSNRLGVPKSPESETDRGRHEG